jgi:signal transduction histidine kinase
LLNNAIKHASAESLGITLNFLPDKILLIIKDDGVGFNPNNQEESTSDVNTGTGTFNLQYRAKLIGAKYTVRSEPGIGTEVILEIPATNKHSDDNHN